MPQVTSVQMSNGTYRLTMHQWHLCNSHNTVTDVCRVARRQSLMLNMLTSVYSVQWFNFTYMYAGYSFVYLPCKLSVWFSGNVLEVLVCGLNMYRTIIWYNSPNVWVNTLPLCGERDMFYHPYQLDISVWRLNLKGPTLVRNVTSEWHSPIMMSHHDHKHYI